MQKTLIKDILKATNPAKDVTVCGWIRTRRDGKGVTFLELNDGSCLTNLQCVVDAGTEALETLGDNGTGAAIRVEGEVVPSPGKGQAWEVQARAITVFGPADPERYPLQKKRHSDEFLRSIAHLRVRTNKYSAAFRIRSEAAYAIHSFFRSEGFYEVHCPVLTGSDCEGAGEMFRVTTLAPGEKDTSKDFFSHAAEFIMIEPEMAFADLSDLMDLAENLVHNVTDRILTTSAEDISLFDRFVEKGLLDKLKNIASEPFARITYGEAIEILKKSGKKFTYPVSYGVDLQTEHERYLAEEHFGRATIVTDYPKNIKAFYMRNNDDGETVAAMDVLVPRIGELIGGSQREERLDLLEHRILELGQQLSEYDWYLDLRRFGTNPHAGFGLGFERLIMMLTGIANIRDVLPFPRTPGSLEF